MYFNRSSLPWQRLKGCDCVCLSGIDYHDINSLTKKQKGEKTTEIKLSTPVEVLCKKHHNFPTST